MDCGQSTQDPSWDDLFTMPNVKASRRHMYLDQMDAGADPNVAFVPTSNPDRNGMVLWLVGRGEKKPDLRCSELPRPQEASVLHCTAWTNVLANIYLMAHYYSVTSVPKQLHLHMLEDFIAYTAEINAVSYNGRDHRTRHETLRSARIVALIMRYRGPIGVVLG